MDTAPGNSSAAALVRARAVALDLVILGIVFLIEFGTVLSDAPPWNVRPFGASDAARLVVFSGALLVRRRLPLVTLALMTLAFFGSQLLGFGIAAGFYSAGAYAARSRRSLGAVAACVLVVTAWFVIDRNVGGIELLLPASMFGGAWYFGDLNRVRRDYVVLLQERADRAERERADAEERAAAVERARIARELHDIVAHRVSMMTVQAGAARMVVPTDPAAAAEAMGNVEAGGREALAELRRMVGLLRGSDDTDADAPQPGLLDIDALVQDARRSGLDVHLHRDGGARGFSSAVELSAYRIVQEALTNAVKHAGSGARVDVSVRVDADGVELRVTDDGTGGSQAASGGGHGLVGMRERATLVGGWVVAGPREGGGFEVRASLPASGEPA